MSTSQSMALARDARRRNAALRATDDPVVLAKAARIVRAAIERGKLSKSDLDGPIVRPEPDATPALPPGEQRAS
jgi:hypothetical protein